MIHSRIWNLAGNKWLVLRWRVKLLFLPGLHRLSLHGGLRLLGEYNWLEAAALHHLTLDNLESLLFPLLVKFVSVFKFLRIRYLYVLNHTFLTDLPHHLFGHFWDGRFERTDFFQLSLSLLGALLLLLCPRGIPVDRRLVEMLISSPSFWNYQLAVFIYYRFVWVLFILVLLLFLISFLQVNFFLLFYKYIFISLMQRSSIRNLNLLTQLLFGRLWNQLFTEGS